ncbi:MAG: NrfD/PsrC family molybdoenzyme membrane anchor subunit [Planctomycetota bacterium]
MGHHYNWGLPLIIDLFAAAMGASAFMVAVIADLADRKNKYLDVSFTGAAIAPWPVILGVALLVVDLGNPLRFWEMILKRGDGLLTLEFPFIQFVPSSVMSWGTWVLSLFVIVSFCYLAAHVASYALHWVAPIRKIIGVIGILFALPVTVYTGVLIASCNNALWNSPLLPTLFVASALASGLAVVVFVLSCIRIFLKTEPREPNVRRLEKACGYMLGFQLVLLVAFILTGIGSPLMRAMIGHQFGVLFWVGIVGLCTIVPIAALLMTRERTPQTSLVLAGLILLGGFFMRYALLIAGQTI